MAGVALKAQPVLPLPLSARIISALSIPAWAALALEDQPVPPLLPWCQDYQCPNRTCMDGTDTESPDCATSATWMPGRSTLTVPAWAALALEAQPVPPLLPGCQEEVLPVEVCHLLPRPDVSLRHHHRTPPLQSIQIVR